MKAVDVDWTTYKNVGIPTRKASIPMQTEPSGGTDKLRADYQAPAYHYQPTKLYVEFSDKGKFYIDLSFDWGKY